MASDEPESANSPLALAFAANSETLSKASRARLITAFDSILYVDADSEELRHGPLDTSPANAILLYEAGRAKIMRETGAWLEPIAYERNCCRVGGRIFEIVDLGNGMVGFTSQGTFLCAEPDGRVTLSRKEGLMWESFRLARFPDSPEPAAYAQADHSGSDGPTKRTAWQPAPVAEGSPGISPARVVTAYGSVLYVDIASGELRHGPPESSPANAILVRDGKRGRILHQEGASRAPIAFEDDCCLTAERGLEIVELNNELVALKGYDLFLCAELDGRISLSRSQALLWESFQLESDLAKQQARSRPTVPVETVLTALKAGNLSLAARRANKLLQHFPESSQLFEVLGDIALRRRDFAGAVVNYEAALARDATLVDCAEKCAMARLYRRLSERLAAASTDMGQPRAMADYTVAVINLDRSESRLRRTTRQFGRRHILLQRIPGVPGGYIPSVAVARLTSDGNAPRGTLGCLLGHTAAWEALLKSDRKHCLVIEDDVALLIDLPARFALFGIADDYDICFVNRRMQAALSAEERDAAVGFLSVPVYEAVRNFPRSHTAPGGDGYFVSVKGARKLLDFVLRDGFAVDVDWRLLGYSLTPEQVKKLPYGTASAVLSALLPGIKGEERLTAYVLYPSLIDTVALDSDRSEHDHEGHGA
jgi:GR25 family glycosyltransferase involved in LPS biosynthesis